MKFTNYLAIAIALTLVNAGVIDRRQSTDSEKSNNDSSAWSYPLANGGKSWKEAFKKASDIVAQLSLEEKVNFVTGQEGRCVGTTGTLSGVEGLEEHGLCLEDGPAGVRPVHGVSQFSSGQALVATWDRDLIERVQKAKGQEFFDQGVHIHLGPVSSGPLGRSPLGGRNWEGSSPDPYLNGAFTYHAVRGVQDASVAAVTKHFIGYEQETFRHPYNTSQPDDVLPLFDQLPISSNIDDLTTHELYMPSFGEAIRAGSAHIMCSYNDVNGTHACENSYTLNHLLKDELNFQGSVISDWGGQWNNDASSLNGMDVGMPGRGYGGSMGSFWGPDLTDLINNGTVPTERLDDQVKRLLTPYYWLGQDNEHRLPDVVFNGNKHDKQDEDGYRDVTKPETSKLIRETGEQSATLLKNTGGLPLNKPQRLVLLGDIDDNELGPTGCGDSGNSCPEGNHNGTLTLGGGSGYAYPSMIVTPLDAFKLRAVQDRTELQYASKYDEKTIQTIAPTSDATIVFVDNFATEEKDRHTLDLEDEQYALIRSAVNSSSNVILVMHTPGVVNIEEFADNENVTAIVNAYYPGQESGSSIVPVLFGDINPSGKLPYTWGKSISDWPNTIVTDAVEAPQSDFTEGLFIDYRWFDKNNIEPRYEFGFGLSYTQFSYSDITVEDNSKDDDSAIQETNEAFETFNGNNSLYDNKLTVKAQVQNNGDVKGSEIAQLYISTPVEDRPIRQLRGFEKVKDLEPGQSQTVEFNLRLKDLSSWSVEKQLWYLPKGEFTFYVGTSSRNLPLSTTWNSN